MPFKPMRTRRFAPTPQKLTKYKLGLIYNRFQAQGNDQYSFILPFEKNLNHFIFNSSLVYKNSSLENDYYGIENAFTIPLRNDDFVFEVQVFSVKKLEPRKLL